MANTLTIDGTVTILNGKEIILPLSTQITLPEVTGSAAQTGSVYSDDQWVGTTWVPVITGSTGNTATGRLRWMSIQNYGSGSSEVAVSMSLSSSGANNWQVGVLEAGDTYMSTGKPIALYVKSHSAGAKIGVTAVYVNA